MPDTRAAPPPSLAPQIAPPPLADSYVALQDYREKAPIGIDIDYVNSRYFNADGWNWGYSDVEGAWNDTHQDLSQISGDVYINGLPSVALLDAVPNSSFQEFKDHGTAVVGILSSDNNSFGTTGLVPSAAVRLSTHTPATGYNPAAAITAAANQFWKGSAILLEMQTNAAFDCNGDADKSPAYVPIEAEAASKAAIKTAVANGRIVVEAAGNGNCDLDQAGFKGAFDVNDLSKDSGAIIVGAGEKVARKKAWFSTYGSRVDTHAEGDNRIYTTGYGNFYMGEGEDLWYMQSFGGTSGASPIVTGAAVSLSSILWEYHGSFWNPKEMR
ncbi:MAG: S8 family serine peptidase, partial [Saprospiraceae bacterium]|nr:S8 family serine peptidase [Saprospiraceae bacterium]